jgi:hypothetical protein
VFAINPESDAGKLSSEFTLDESGLLPPLTPFDSIPLLPEFWATVVRLIGGGLVPTFTIGFLTNEASPVCGTADETTGKPSFILLFATVSAFVKFAGVVEFIELEAKSAKPIAGLLGNTLRDKELAATYVPLLSIVPLLLLLLLLEFGLVLMLAMLFG